MIYYSGILHAFKFFNENARLPKAFEFALGSLAFLRDVVQGVTVLGFERLRRSC